MDAAIGGILKLQVSAKGLSDRMIKSERLSGMNMINVRGYCGARFIEIHDERLWPERYRELLDEHKAVCESLLSADAADIRDAVIELTALYETVAADTYQEIVAEVEAQAEP